MSRFRPRSGPLAKLLTGWLLDGTGGSAFTIVAAVYAFDRSGAGAVGLVTAAGLFPRSSPRRSREGSADNEPLSQPAGRPLARIPP